MADEHFSYGGQAVIEGVMIRGRKGYATEMLRQTLPICSSLGIAKVLITCDIGNQGSRNVIENCGGVFENLTADPQLDVQKRRYWIDCPAVGD